jgi:hypothetical protein
LLSRSRLNELPFQYQISIDDILLSFLLEHHAISPMMLCSMATEFASIFSVKPRRTCSKSLPVRPLGGLLDATTPANRVSQTFESSFNRTLSKMSKVSKADDRAFDFVRLQISAMADCDLALGPVSVSENVASCTTKENQVTFTVVIPPLQIQAFPAANAEVDIRNSNLAILSVRSSHNLRSRFLVPPRCSFSKATMFFTRLPALLPMSALGHLGMLLFP